MRHEYTSDEKSDLQNLGLETNFHILSPGSPATLLYNFAARNSHLSESEEA